MAVGKSSFVSSDYATVFWPAYILVTSSQASVSIVTADDVPSRNSDLAVRECRLARFDGPEERHFI